MTKLIVVETIKAIVVVVLFINIAVLECYPVVDAFGNFATFPKKLFGGNTNNVLLSTSKQQQIEIQV
jgi:hypothetical protein